jgi:tetratricopeptide (TPR) repeat protein
MLIIVLTLVVNLVVAAGEMLTSAVTASAQTPAVAADRFDMVVRTDFFAGFAGDAGRLARGMATCERYLAANPNHAEALVWHGSGLVYQASEAFRRGDPTRGGELWSQGLAEMQRAVALEPDNIGVRVPRGAVLMQASRGLPDEGRRPILELAVDDYEHVLALQTPHFATLSEHARGQLLFGLADGSARLGRLDKAREYFNRLVTDAPDSALTPRARQWLTEGTLPAETGLGCVGCHK